ncbi:hypothetical protein WMF11_12255 [Sorangium sp. So ce295]|uniref:hypothetical protein n=1 Tax=Sorangium sp. So ce295 TaxID=3133295 RepID=UPI003F624FF0
MVFSKALFDLQLSFAEKVRALSGMSLAKALFEYTNLYVRFGLGRELDAQDEAWQAHVAGLPGAGGGEAGRDYPQPRRRSQGHAPAAPRRAPARLGTERTTRSHVST